MLIEEPSDVEEASEVASSAIDEPSGGSSDWSADESSHGSSQELREQQLVRDYDSSPQVVKRAGRPRKASKKDGNTSKKQQQKAGKKRGSKDDTTTRKKHRR